jgi:hypothetical protein
MSVERNTDDSVYMLKNAYVSNSNLNELFSVWKCWKAESEKSHVSVLFHTFQFPTERSILYISVTGICKACS